MAELPTEQNKLKPIDLNNPGLKVEAEQDIRSQVETEKPFSVNETDLTIEMINAGLEESKANQDIINSMPEDSSNELPNIMPKRVEVAFDGLDSSEIMTTMSGAKPVQNIELGSVIFDQEKKAKAEGIMGAPSSQVEISEEDKSKEQVVSEVEISDPENNTKAQGIMGAPSSQSEAANLQEQPIDPDPEVGKNVISQATQELVDLSSEASNAKVVTLGDVVEASYKPPDDKSASSESPTENMKSDALDRELTSEQIRNAAINVNLEGEPDMMAKNQTLRSDLVDAAMQGVESSGGATEGETSKIQSELSGQNPEHPKIGDVTFHNPKSPEANASEIMGTKSPTEVPVQEKQSTPVAKETAAQLA